MQRRRNPSRLTVNEIFSAVKASLKNRIDKRANGRVRCVVEGKLCIAKQQSIDIYSTQTVQLSLLTLNNTFLPCVKLAKSFAKQISIIKTLRASHTTHTHAHREYTQSTVKPLYMKGREIGRRMASSMRSSFTPLPEIMD